MVRASSNIAGISATCCLVMILLPALPVSAEVLWRGDLIPSRSYAEFVKGLLLETPSIRPAIRAALRMEKPTSVFWSVLENGQVALLNFSNHPATVRLTSGKSVTIPPYEMAMERVP